MDVFKTKKFDITQEQNVIKVNTDAILLAAWTDYGKADSILDIGTGTGIIALIAAQKSDAKEIVGIEISEKCAQEAKVNFEGSLYASTLKVVCDRIQDFAKFSLEKYALIISNPPFFSGGTFSDNENKHNVKHSPKLSVGDLLIAVRKLMKPDGRFTIVLPYLEGERFIDMAARYDLYPDNIMEIRNKKNNPIERLLISLKFDTSAGNIIRKDFCMYDEDDRYTSAYLEMTEDILIP